MNSRGFRSIAIGAAAILGLVLTVGALFAGPDVFLLIVGVLALAAAALLLVGKRGTTLGGVALAALSAFPLVMIRMGPSQEDPTAFALLVAGGAGWILLALALVAVVAGALSLRR